MRMAANDAQVQKIHEVVGRVLSDPSFAEQVKADGLAAVQAGAGSDAWNKYFEYFAPEPGALAGMGVAGAAACTCNSTTFTTLSTLVTPIPTCCGLTTTTTTSAQN
jgi:hypothetical protein